MAQLDAMSASQEQSAPLGLTVGDIMPTHAFTRQGLLLLAQGERIVASSQLDRLLAEDVIFSDEPPPRVQAAIEARYRSLGLRPSRREHQPSPSGEPERALLAPPRPTTLAEELPRAREIRGAMVAQVKRFVTDVRSGLPIDITAARHTVVKVAESLRRSPRAFGALVRLKRTDEYTFSHSVNTCVLSLMVAEQCGLPDNLEDIGLGALVHDVGKLKVPPEVLNKPGPLTEEEWQLIRRHPLAGLEIVQRSGELRAAIAEAITQHHERADGSGYPHGLRGEAIGMAARLVAVVDVYDATSSDRPYHPALPPAEAVRWILANAGRQFDLQLAHAFVRTVGVYPVGSLVRLNSGELAIVSDFDAKSILRPIVLIITTPWGSALPAPEILDLSEGFPAAAKREIVAVENPATLDIDVEHHLSLTPVTADADLSGLDSHA